LPVRLLRLVAAAALAAALAAAPAARAQSACDGRPIRGLWIVTTSLFGPDDSAYVGVVRTVANAVHGRTRSGVVRRELLFAPGDPCDPARLAETARVLRAQPYIRDVRITTLEGDGGPLVLVRTRDEWSLRLDGRVRTDQGWPLRRLGITEENLFGRAIRAQLRYDLRRRRPGYDLDLTHHQLLGRLDAQVIGGRSSVGAVAEQRVLRPFESEYDRVAWRESARFRKEPFELIHPAFGRVDQPLLASGADLGFAVRAGQPGRLVMTGAALSADRIAAVDAPMAERAADDSAAAALLAGRFAERRRVRVHLFAGVRALAFRPHVGLDAVRAEEDVREGVEVGLVAGKSIGGAGGLQRDWFAAVELYAGADLGRTLAFARGKLEGRYLLAERRWDGVLLNGECLVYTSRSPVARGVVVLGAAFSGGWHLSTPFQLALAGENGIRGYGRRGLPVGRRMVMQAEHRYFAGTLLGAVDIGTAAFVDLGRGWAGEAPFGHDTGLLAAVGAGLRIAAPRGSRRTYRIDLAMPLSRGRGPELQFGARQQLGVIKGEAEDVARSRERVSSTTIFNFPRF